VRPRVECSRFVSSGSVTNLPATPISPDILDSATHMNKPKESRDLNAHSAESAQSVSSTKNLVDQGKAGDQGAFDRVFAKVLPRVRRWAHGRIPRGTRSTGDTADVVQDAALRAWRRINHVTLSQKGDFEAYVRHAVQNRIRDEARVQRRRPAPDQLDIDVQDDQPSPLDQAVEAQAARRYETAFSQLTDEERELLLARFEFGFSHQQVAELLGKPSAAAARMATVRAVERLKALMAAM